LLLPKEKVSPQKARRCNREMFTVHENEGTRKLVQVVSVCTLNCHPSKIRIFLFFILPSLSSSVIFSFNETALAISGTIDISSHDRMCEGEKSMQMQPIFASLWARYETTKSEQHSTALTMVKPGQLRSAEAEQYATNGRCSCFHFVRPCPV